MSVPPFDQLSCRGNTPQPSGWSISKGWTKSRAPLPKGPKYTLVNLGVSPRYDPTTPQGVPIYLHDYFGPGRHAKVVSTRAKDLIGDGNKYREEPPLTGNESRVAEVRNIPFPQLLDPVDDLPPATIITHAIRQNGKFTVRGTTSDNGKVTKVTVNGQAVRAVRSNYAEWEIALPDPGKGRLEIRTHAEDEAGNTEKLPHIVVK